MQTSIEDMVYAIGTFRIRQYFLGLDPAAAPFLPPTDPQGMTKLERIGVVATGPLQMLLTSASMVGCINAIVGGVAVALALRAREAPVPAAGVTGALVAVGLAALCFGYQVRRFRRAAAVVPELYEGRARACPDGPSAPRDEKHSQHSQARTTVSGNQVRLRLPPKAARTEGPPGTRTGR